MKKGILLILKVVFSVGILVYIFTKVVNVGDLWANLIEADVSYLVAAVAVYFVVQTLSAYRWYLLLKPQGIETRFPRVLALYYLGMYFNFFLPSAIGGDVFKVYYLHKETGRLSASTASVFLDRDIGMGGLLLAATLVAAYGGTRIPPENGVLLAPVFGLIGVVFVAANLALFYRRSYDLLHRLLSLFRMKKADEKVERLFESVNSYRGKWGLAAITLVISLGVQVGCAFSNLLAAAAIGLHTQHGWIDYMVFIPAIGLIGMIPLSVNGAGWRELSYVLLFQSVGAEAHQAATLSLLWLGIMITRNSHPLHFDEVYCREHSFMKTRVVEGGLVFAWTASLASRDTTANALWEIGYDKGIHPAPVLAGDTLYAASRVIGKRDHNEQAGIVRFKLVGVKNALPANLIQQGADLFEGKFNQKVFEIEREVLLLKRLSLQ